MVRELAPSALHYVLFQGEAMFREYGAEATVRLLIELGADPGAKDSDRLTPSDLAARAGNAAGVALQRALARRA